MQQKFLDFSVDGQNIHAPHQKVVADSRNYLLARFSFDEVWQGLTKTAVFQGADGKVYHMLLEGDSCAIPAEVIKPTRFTVSVFGGDRLTTDRAVVEVAASGMLDGVIPPVPTPDIYTQLTETVALERQIAQSAAVTATEKAEQCAEAAKNTDEILETVIAANEIAADAVECAQKAGEQAAKAELAADAAATHAAYAEQQVSSAVSAAHSALDAADAATTHAAYAEQQVSSAVSAAHSALNAAEQATADADAAATSAAAAAESARLSQIAEQRYAPKLLRTHTMTEAASYIDFSFDRPLKEIFFVFKGGLDITSNVNNCILACRTDGGMHYLMLAYNFVFSSNADVSFIFHAKEVAQRYWINTYSRTTLSPTLQGIAGDYGDLLATYSYRRPVIPQYISEMQFFVFNDAYNFREGTTVEIWGVEAE